MFPVGLIEEEAGRLQVAMDGRCEGLFRLQTADDEGRGMCPVGGRQHLQYLRPAGVARPLLQFVKSCWLYSEI